MKNNFKNFILENNIILILILIIMLAIILAPNFTKARNLHNLLLNCSTYGLLALGFTLVLIVGGIDLSIGYQTALAATITIIISNKYGAIVGIPAGIASGLITGYLNSIVITILKVPPLVATLATMSVYQGLVLYITNNASVASTDPYLFNVFIFKFFSIQSPIVIFIIVFLVFSFLLGMTRTGVNIYIVGGNEETGILYGINVNAVKRLCYILMGLCCGIVGVLLSSKLSAASFTLGYMLDISAISSCVIGGIKFGGGHGNMIKALLGVAVIQCINNMMVLLAFHGSIQILVTGTIVILVLLGDKFTQNRHNMNWLIKKSVQGKEV